MVCSLYEEREDSAALAVGAPLSDKGVDIAAGQGRSSGSTQERPEEAATAPERIATSDSVPDGSDGRANGSAHRIRYADDLKPDEDSIHLPLIQCRECHSTGWGCVKHAAEHRVGQDLRVFYNRFFLRDVDVNYLFPLAPDEPQRRRTSGGVNRRSAADAVTSSRLGTAMPAPAAATIDSHASFAPTLSFPGGAERASHSGAEPGLPVLRGAGGAHHPGRPGIQPAQHRARPVVRFPPQRRSQGHRLLGQRAGRRAPGLVLRGADLAQRHPLRHRPGGRGTGGHRTRRAAGSSHRVVGSTPT